MRVIVNGRYLSQRVTGVERYARELMARRSVMADLVAPSKPARGMRGHLWEQSVLPARIGRDLLFSPCNTGPLAVSRQVVTIHDCAFFDQPEGFAWKFAAWYHWLVPKLARRIRRIITVSEFSRQRLVEYCQVPAEKIVVIPQGVDAKFRPMLGDELTIARQRLNLPQRYVLYVGNLVPRKNLARLIAAWRMVSPQEPGLSLVLAGASDRVFRDPALGELPSSVLPVGYVADDLLPALYGGAEFFVFPSLYEGFGLPVLEAMACGVPVMTSNVTSLPEVAGDAALLVDPYSVEALADGLRQLITDKTKRDELARRGLARSQGFSWDHTASRTWEVLQQAADN